MREVYVFGHKNPDTDSVTSAIALSNLKNILGIPAKPMILGPVNRETEYALDYFKVETPELLEDVKLQIKDLIYYKDCYVYEEDSINKTYNYMCEKNITGVPVVDKNQKFKGLLTTKMIGSELISGDFTHLNTSYDNIVDVLRGESVLKFDEEISGNIIVAAYRSTTFLNTIEFKDDTIMIVGDRDSLIEAAINSKIKLIIIVGDLNINTTNLELASKNKVNIIKTCYDSFHVAKLIGLSNYSKNLIKSMRNVCFNENDYYDDFKEKGVKFGFNNYPVVDNKKRCLGLIRVTDLNKINRKQVILVDHNELSQSVDGLEEAEILEIIDHHKLGSITTSMPINFRNMIVGSTNTIIYSLYQENNVEIDPKIAGLMLSGIISDTLKLTSPTTTEYDIYVANKLASISNTNIDSFAKEMFKAGTALKGKTIEEIIDMDLKVFDHNNKKIAISQVLTLHSEEILEKSSEYIKTINEVKKNRGYDTLILSVTDIIKNGSYIFFDEGSLNFISNAFDKEISEGYFLDKFLSRKKQLVPIIMNEK